MPVQDGTCLSPYRVLDLSREGCSLCGRILGDLGADVIRIERPGGDPDRSWGPFVDDNPDPERSLFWFAYNGNKRGITLDITSLDGRRIFMMLAGRADFIIESFPPGYMDRFGLGYPDLAAVNPRLVMASITPFGREGPHAGLFASDLITMAMSGFMYLHGDPDRPPVWISFPQASIAAGADCAAAMLIAHRHRQESGEGQHIDLSIQESVTNMLFNATLWWDIGGKDLTRKGDVWQIGSVVVPFGFRCRDGYVSFNLLGGGRPSNVASSVAMVDWMQEHGMAPGWLTDFDWIGEFDTTKITQATVDCIVEAISRFLATRTKEEIMERALAHNIIISPVSTVQDIWESRQYAQRGFFRQVDHPELGKGLPYCGPFARLSRTPIVTTRRAPLIGEHNREIYEVEMAIPMEELLILKQALVI